MVYSEKFLTIIALRKCEDFVFVCFVGLRPKSTAMVMAGQVSSPNCSFSWVSLNKQLASTSCTYIRL